MKISISNIAWNKDDDEIVYELLQKNNIEGLDVAPARVFNNPVYISKEEGQGFIKYINEKGLTPIGMQSLLFGTEGLSLFDNQIIRQQTIDHLKSMIDYASKIGITRLVFGSPKNRLTLNKPASEIKPLAYDVFNELGEHASSKNIFFCIEPNPKVYGADFITTTYEGIELVKEINNPGFRLHMDLGTMLINNENIDEVIEQGIAFTEHVHLSHPNLEQVIGMEEVHKIFHKALKRNGYKGAVAIEMKNSMLPDNVDRIRKTVEFISSVYGGDE